MSLCIVGSVALDTVYTSSGSREGALGGSASYFSLAASRLADVQMLAVVGQDFPASAFELFQAHHINTEGLTVAEGKTFAWGGRYHDDMKGRDTLFTDLNVFKKFKPVLPSEYAESDYLFLGNIHPSLQLEVLKQMKNDPIVGLDSMNLWIDTAREDLMKVISKINILMINDEEIIQLTGMEDTAEAAKEMMKKGPECIVVKRGKYGSDIYYRDQHESFGICPEIARIDPTGAGDTFAGGFMGYLSKCTDPCYTDYLNAMRYGTVLASFAVESFSVDRLVEAGEDEIESRLKLFKEQAC